MSSEGIRARSSKQDVFDIGAGATPSAPPLSRDTSHPAGKVKHGPLTQILRAVVSVGWFLSSCLCLSVTQFIGAPLYYHNKQLFYTWMSYTKQSFSILIIMVTQSFSPTLIRISWESSMRGQLALSSAGRLETRFPERIVLMANHQIYTDWIYLWWVAYTSKMHGAFFIILKESLRYIPILGWGMMFFGFIFMKRQWNTDRPRLQHRLQQLSRKHVTPKGSPGLDPMWLLIFPEGTNLSANTRKKSVAWSQKSGIPDGKNVLLPRSTGMHFCLMELQKTVDWVYDCTVAYEGTPRGGYAQDFFTLRSTFLQGRPPKSVNIYWRRFAVQDIPLHSQTEFQKWVEDRWREKDALLETYFTTGRFPADEEDGKAPAYIETAVKLRSWVELMQPYVVILTAALLLNIVRRFWQVFVTSIG